MLWQPHTLPQGDGRTDYERNAGTTTTQVRSHSFTIGKLTHLGGAVGSVLVQSRLAVTPTATVYAVTSQSHAGNHVLKCIDLRRVHREAVVREVALQRQAAGPWVIGARASTFVLEQAYLLLERGADKTVEDLLVDALAQGEPIAVHTVLRWFDDMVQALRHCHRVGIVHRDIKPDNMVLVGGPQTAQMHVKLMDFGLATTSATSGHAVGTITYMAPELLREQTATAAVDLWSLGVTLYRMLVGIEPYYDDSAEQIALRLLRGTPQFTIEDLDKSLFIRGVAKDLRCRIIDVVDRLLDPNPKTRQLLWQWRR